MPGIFCTPPISPSNEAWGYTHGGENATRPHVNRGPSSVDSRRLGSWAARFVARFLFIGSSNRSTIRRVHVARTLILLADDHPGVLNKLAGTATHRRNRG